MILPIRYFGDPLLRKAARPVREFDAELARLAEDMRETMYDANGIGLAAPQVGIPKRLFIALEIGPTDSGDEEDPDGLSADEKRERWGVLAEHVMVNPVITERRGVQYGQDGCLSLPGLFVERMRRDFGVTVSYQDLGGEHHTLTAEGRFAHVLQHELDHLDGVLFIDRLPEDERRAFMETHRTELAEMQRQAKALLKQLKGEPSPARVR